MSVAFRSRSYDREMIARCTASVTSMYLAGRSSAISGSDRAAATCTIAAGSALNTRPSSTISPHAPASAIDATYRRCEAASAPRPIPVDSSSSPPLIKVAMSAISAMCTQRTGRSSDSAPATTRAPARRSTSSASTSRNVTAIPVHTTGSLEPNNAQKVHSGSIRPAHTISPMTTEQAKAAPQKRYRQELDRSIGVLGNIFITLSGVTPAVSVFVIAPVALAGGGSGAFLAFVFAALVGVFMAVCWAELSAAFPIAGGDYAMVWHAYQGKPKAEKLAGPASFVTFMLWLDFIAFIPAVIALGAGLYLSPILHVSSNGVKVVGAVFMLAGAVLAALKIRFNAWLTGVFLGIEMLCLLIVTVLGIFHTQHWSSLLHPTMTGARGGGVLFSAVVALTATAVFSYNGYAGSVNFAEETKGSSRNIARAILWSLVITVAAELIPLTATILGAPSLGKLTGSVVPMQYFIEATSTSVVYNVISIGIVLATLNAVIAILLAYGRVLYSAARDHAFYPPPVNEALTRISRRFGSPWLATLL